MIVMSGLFTHAWFFLGFSTCFYTKCETVRYSYVSLSQKNKEIADATKVFFLPSFCFSVLDVFIISDANSVSFFPILEVFRLLRQHRRHRVCMRRTAYRPEKTTCLDSMEYSSTLKVYYPAFWWRNFTTSRRFRSALYGSSIIIWYMIHWYMFTGETKPGSVDRDIIWGQFQKSCYRKEPKGGSFPI